VVVQVLPGLVLEEDPRLALDDDARQLGVRCDRDIDCFGGHRQLVDGVVDQIDSPTNLSENHS
jgi:hypothetical protein